MLLYLSNIIKNNKFTYEFQKTQYEWERFLFVQLFNHLISCNHQPKDPRPLN